MYGNKYYVMNSRVILTGDFKNLLIYFYFYEFDRALSPFHIKESFYVFSLVYSNRDCNYFCTLEKLFFRNLLFLGLTVSN